MKKTPLFTSRSLFFVILTSYKVQTPYYFFYFWRFLARERLVIQCRMEHIIGVGPVRNKSGLSYLYCDGWCSGIHALTGATIIWKLLCANSLYRRVVLVNFPRHIRKIHGQQVGQLIITTLAFYSLFPCMMIFRSYGPMNGYQSRN